MNAYMHDAERLNWLERAAEAGMYIESDPISGVGIWIKNDIHGGEPDFAEDSLREAIDAARKDGRGD